MCDAITGSGYPGDTCPSAPVGTYYINEDDGSPWIKTADPCTWQLATDIGYAIDVDSQEEGVANSPLPAPASVTVGHGAGWVTVLDLAARLPVTMPDPITAFPHNNVQSIFRGSVLLVVDDGATFIVENDWAARLNLNDGDVTIELLNRYAQTIGDGAGNPAGLWRFLSDANLESFVPPGTVIASAVVELRNDDPAHDFDAQALNLNLTLLGLDF